METILQSILDVAGVSAALVFDATGRLVSYRGHAIYDRSLCEQLSSTLIKAIDTVQLQQDDWESISAQYADGRLLLRKLGPSHGTTHILAIVADSTLNASFAIVAIRVAANKLRKAIENGVAPPSTSAPLSRTPLPPAAVTPSLSDSKPVLANTGLSWSKASSSSISLSRISVADPASAEFLTHCAKELARHVGPMAKVYLEEAVRRVSPDAPFSLAASAKLLEDLANQIEDTDDRTQFCKALAKG